MAAELITITLETMHQFRTDEVWSKIYKYTVEVANLHEIPVACLAQFCRTRQHSKRMTDYIVTENTGIRSHHDVDSEVTEPMTTYKCRLYFHVFDHLILVAELNRRFTDIKTNPS